MSFWDGTRWIDESKPLPSDANKGSQRGRIARLGDQIATGAMVVGLVALFIPLASASASATAATPVLSASPISATAGTSITVRGSGFSKNLKGKLVLDSATTGTVFHANASGAFSVSLTLPISEPTGSHSVSARSSTSSVPGKSTTGSTSDTTLASTSISVVSSPDPTPTPTTAPTAAPTPTPTSTPTPTPTSTPTPTPTSTPTPTPTPTPTTQTNGFVQANGTQLTLNGVPYRFTGFNIYNANSRDNCWYPLGYNNSALDDALTAVGPGQNAFRAWFYQDLATSNGVRDWSAFDHTIAVAKAHNVRIIATLADQWGSCDSGPNGAVFKGDAWYTTDYRSTVAPGTTEAYRNWVAEIVARYKNEPTILAWQLMNEAEIRHDITASCTANGATILRTWAADVSGLIKSIDSNHLVSLGTLGGGQCGTQGSDYEYVHNLPTIDLCEYHDYLPDAMPGDQWNGLAVRINQCATLGKPIFIGETGQENMSLTTRASVFASKFATQFGAGVVGELVWALRIDSQGGSSTTNYDMGPTDLTVALFGQY